MSIAIYPGSFDPITYGHLDVIRRAAKVFDQLIVGILNNEAKHPLFTIEEKMEMIEEAIKDLPNVEVRASGGLLVDFSEKMGADVIVRGIRTVSDFEAELMMAQVNKKLNSNIETMFLATSDEYSFVSSSTVREIAHFGGDISQFVPDFVAEEVYKKFPRK